MDICFWPFPGRFMGKGQNFFGWVVISAAPTEVWRRFGPIFICKREYQSREFWDDLVAAGKI